MTPAILPRPTSRHALVLALLVAALGALGALVWRAAPPHPLAALLSPSLDAAAPAPPARPGDGRTAPFVCRPHAYTAEIISVDPVVLYLRGFVSGAEIAALLGAGAAAGFAPSRVQQPGAGGGGGRDRSGTAGRTSASAALPPGHPAVRCVLARAARLLGPALRAPGDAPAPQLVRYAAGQHFGPHRDWFPRPQRPRPAAARPWNRVASFFAVLEDACAGGETWFPRLAAPAPLSAGPEEKEKEEEEEEEVGGHRERPLWRAHEDGGLAFRPVAGNALFWVNLFANGTGDDRTVHAGLPVEAGVKTAMNIWPRRYYD
ncbi:hypothetical protein GGS23DRAFT_619889 [Durotheca rogersii]|uniref:uncharacterized protein n=1 Tax=Durotheca rogersii TaxID=419775 RepID=UPI00221FEE96|nr:uncharacterized protein GGS23DRAFT_619889 [Durotheca rogersii]KAI5864091.1 hypothetical protein GGS23DRAFT_619889 [Durotheca rogersii]